MCNHSMIQGFDGQDYCVTCGEELDTDTGVSLKQQEIEDNDIDYQMDDSSGTDGDWVEREEEHYLNSFGE